MLSNSPTLSGTRYGTETLSTHKTSARPEPSVGGVGCYIRYSRAMNSKTLINLQRRPCMLSYINTTGNKLYMNKRINAQLFIVRSHRPAILADNRPVDLWHSRLITSTLCELICIRQASMGLRVSLWVGNTGTGTGSAQSVGTSS